MVELMEVLLNELNNPINYRIIEKDFDYNQTIVLENEDSYSYQIFTAGTKKEDIGIEIVENKIVISWSRKKPENYETKSTLYGEWERKITINNEMDIDNLVVEYIDGVINITIPKKQKTKRRIEIN